MASPNYRHEKRQKDLARQKKQEEKRLRKVNKQGGRPEDDAPQGTPPEAPQATPPEGEQSSSS